MDRKAAKAGHTAAVDYAVLLFKARVCRPTERGAQLFRRPPRRAWPSPRTGWRAAMSRRRRRKNTPEAKWHLIAKASGAPMRSSMLWPPNSRERIAGGREGRRGMA